MHSMCRQTLMLHVRAGHLPCVRFASYAVFFRPEDVEGFIEKHVEVYNPTSIPSTDMVQYPHIIPIRDFNTNIARLYESGYPFMTAERVGFEPTTELPLYTLSRRGPSATRPPLR